MTLAEVTHVVLRVGAGLLFLQHGLSKVFGLLGGTAQPLASVFGVAGLMELIGGALLIVGFLTRPVAAVLMLEMCVAYTTHMSHGPWPIQNDGEEALLYALIFAFFAANGAGPASVDDRLKSRRARL
jgi:putative oxidoreductase